MIPPSPLGIKLLRETLDQPDAEFNSAAQCFVLDQLIKPVMNVFSILPTASGKTLSYILTARYLQQRSFGSAFIVVVVPFTHLITDIMHRCKQFKVPAGQLEYGCDGTVQGMLDRNVSPILLISADKFATSDTIEEFLRVSKEKQRLHCIIFDEVHAILESHRRKLLSLPSRIVRVGVPVFLNSGTVTPSNEATIRDLFGELTSFHLNLPR